MSSHGLTTARHILRQSVKGFQFYRSNVSNKLFSNRKQTSPPVTSRFISVLVCHPLALPVLHGINDPRLHNVIRTMQLVLWRPAPMPNPPAIITCNRHQTTRMKLLILLCLIALQ